MFRRVDNNVDANLLQLDLQRLVQWCNINKMQLNVSKCHVVHFSKKRNKLFHGYSLNEIPLSKLDNIRDLGVTFSSHLTFNIHIHNVSGRAFKKLEFIMRSCKYFRNINTLKLLYCTLVRPQLEYCSVIWARHQSKYCNAIEKIQHRFLRKISFIMGHPMMYTNHNYTPTLCNLNIMTLEDRRIFLGLTFLFKLINGHIICSELLEQIALHVPSKPLRNSKIFDEEFHRTVYGKFKPLNRLCIFANQYVDRVDFFSQSFDSFKRSIACYLR